MTGHHPWPPPFRSDLADSGVCALCHAAAPEPAFIAGEAYCDDPDVTEPTCYERARTLKRIAAERTNRAHPETWSDDT